ncbi:MAG: TRAP transporter large permease [Firmicutes bacterium]|nr:TRAP transporter large permease [Bacillota bacterium]
MSIAVLVILSFLLLVFLGLPIAFAFATASLAFLTLNLGSSSLPLLVSRTFGSIDSFPLMAIPFFVLSGDLMKESGISRGLVNFAELFIGKIKGGLGHVTVLACMFFGAISGSSAATVAAIGGIMVPEMVSRGYDKRYAVALAASSGFLGILIPPSIPLIVYGINAEVSIARLFLGGVGPGVLMGLAFMIVNRIMAPRYMTREALSSEIAGKIKETPLQVGRQAIPALIMPILILGGIYSGAFTPTEAGAVAVVYTLLVGVLHYRSLSPKKLLNIAGGSALTSAVILIIIGFAGVFGWIVTTEQVPARVSQFVTALTNNPYLVLFLLNIFYLILGTFMETVTAIVITTPIFLPLIKALGIDPVYFGVVQTVNLCVGLITPPMALNLLMASKVGQVSIYEVIKPLMPYLITAILVLMLVTYVPQVILFLPNLLLG